MYKIFQVGKYTYISMYLKYSILYNCINLYVNNIKVK